MNTSITEGLYLASQSPRRMALLAQLGWYPKLLTIDFDETPVVSESPEAFVERMARGKARAGLVSLGKLPGCVIAADTEVILDGAIFGKPRDLAHATAMLERLSARTHQVLSAVCVIDARGESFSLSSSEVDFAELSAHTIGRYLATGDSFGKAGAYGVQGHAASFIKAIRGSYSGIMGLPLFETAQLVTARLSGAP